MIGYPGRIPRGQDYTATAHFESRFLAAFHLKPLEIAKLKKCAPSYISNIRKSLLLKIFGIEGSSELFDDEIGKIGRKDTG